MKEGTLNFKKEFKLWKACASDLVRPVMEHVLFKDGYAYASDAHILVRVPLEECTTFDEEQRALLDDRLIHKSMLKFIVGFDIVLIEKGDDDVVCLKARAGENTVKIELAKNGGKLTYPDAEKLLQSQSDCTPIQKIGLAPKLIASFAEALGTDKLKFEFASERSAVRVCPLDVLRQAVGVIMPVML